MLIVDDDTDVRELLTELLRTAGDFRMECAGDGDTGLETARQLRPDLILLDVCMPGLDGFHVCEALRKDPALAEVPVLMVTSLGDEKSRVRGLEAGADDFLAKPFNPTELRARVRTVIRLNRYRKIRDGQARFGWVVEHAQEGYLLLDAEGTLRQANPSARRMLSLASSEGTDMLQVFRQQFSLVPGDLWATWPHTPEVPIFLLRPESKTSAPIWLELSSFVHRAGADLERVLRVRDVTAEIADRRNVWSFEAMVSHKMRTPLTRIAMGVELLARKADRLTPEQIREFAETSRVGVEELNRDLNQVLTYQNIPASALAGDGFPLERLPRLLDSLAQSLGIETRLQLTASGSSRLSIQAVELILLELFRNAKKFHPTRSPLVDVTTHTDRGQLILRVGDDGAGLPPEQLGQIWRPYYQVEPHFTGQLPGMGLGLSGVASMLYEVGGDFTARNREAVPGLIVELRVPLYAGD